MKNFGIGQNKANQTRTKPRRKLSPMVEMVERRQMLDSAIGYLAGTVFFDSAGTGQFAATDTVVKGATVELFKNTTGPPIASTVTDASGNYAFTGIAAGNYTLTEFPPAGQTAVNSQAISQINPASAASAHSINVTVVDPTRAIVNSSGVTEAANPIVANLTVEGTPEANTLSGLGISVGTSAGSTDLSPKFTTYCVDDLHGISFSGGENWSVELQTIGSLTTNGTTPVSADATGRIAFLYNHFGNSSLTNIQEAGLQLAIWELEYDDGAAPNFTAGNFQVGTPLSETSQADLNSAIADATAYYNQSAGHHETAILLNATSAGNPGVTHFQSMIATQTYNFLDANTPAPAPSSLSGYVYVDSNNDGAFEATETPIPNVTVTLTGTTTSGQTVSTVTTTSSTGAYLFSNLAAGTYTITETQPTAYNEGKDTQGTPGTGSAAVQDVFSSITLAAGVNGINNNFGETLPAPVPSSLSGYVYVDSNNDGVFEATETPIPNVTVTLTGTTNSGQAVSAKTTTSSTGAYLFSNLAAGTYTITETQPTAYNEGKDTQGTPGTGSAAVQDVFSSITLAAGVNGINNNFGETLPAPVPSSLSGYVYVDSNNDGVFEATETPIPNVTVTLTGTTTSGQAVSAKTTTGSTGAYLFSNLAAGTYTITETQPTAYNEGKDTQGTPGTGSAAVQDVFSTIKLAAGVNGINNNFGETLPTPTPASVSGFVYVDSNNDGVFETNETPISGVTVTLIGATNQGNAVRLTTVTDSTGAYHFTNLTAGSYSITETQPAGYNEGKDTLGTPTSGSAAVQDIFQQVALVEGENAVDYNFGELLPTVTPPPPPPPVGPVSPNTPVVVTNVTLAGVHEHPTIITVQLSGPVSPTQAQNAANYNLIALGKDEVYGTRDDSHVAIKSVSYDSTSNQITVLPVKHLNLHYHYILSVNLPGDAKHSAVKSVQIFGRSQVPIFNNHGIDRPAPKMTRKEIRHNAAVVARTQATLARHGLIR